MAWPSWKDRDVVAYSLARAPALHAFDIEGGEAPPRRQVENIPQERFTHYLQAHQWARLELHTAKDTTLFECCSNERAH